LSEIIVAIITGGIALIGTVITVVVANKSVIKLVEYRIEQIEKKIERHSDFSDRILALEKDGNQITRELKKLWEKMDKIQVCEK